MCYTFNKLIKISGLFLKNCDFSNIEIKVENESWEFLKMSIFQDIFKIYFVKVDHTLKEIATINFFVKHSFEIDLRPSGDFWKTAKKHISKKVASTTFLTKIRVRAAEDRQESSEKLKNLVGLLSLLTYARKSRLPASSRTTVTIFFLSAVPASRASIQSSYSWSRVCESSMLRQDEDKNILMISMTSFTSENSIWST